ncbi:MAG: cellulase family glycosylhydrolase, partial [Mycobacteriales bacterium]
MPPTRLRRALAGTLALTVAAGLAGVPLLLGSAAATTSPATGNLLVGDTAVLTHGTGTWRGTGTTRLRTRTWPAGNGSLVATASAVGTVVVQTGSGRSGTVPVRKGAVYAGRFALQAGAVSERVQAALVWFDAKGAELERDAVTGAATPDVRGSWTEVTVAGLAPAGASYVALAARLRAAAPGEAHYLSAPRLTAVAGGSAPLSGPLRTAGNKVLDRNGRQVVLRGINRSGLFDTASPGGLTTYDLSRIKAWGGNVVRLTLGQQVWLPGCPTYDPSYRLAVDRAVDVINDLGMLAVLDLQWSAPTCRDAGLNPMPDAGSRTFWKQVSARYANRPLVAFDLFNEPHDVSDATWLNGGPARTASGVRYRAVGMRALYDTVRASGARNLVLVGGLSYASTWPSTAPLRGTTNVVYAVHAYNCDRPWRCTHGTGIRWLLDRFDTPGRTNPVMVTEFGWPDATTPQAQAFNTNVIDYAEAQGWGWLAWAWDVDGSCRTTTWFDLLADGDCSAGDSYQPA